jgi:hypothetical protein
MSECHLREIEVSDSFSKRILRTYQTAPPESQVKPLQMETNLTESLELEWTGFPVLEKQKDQKLRQFCPDNCRPSAG